MDFLRNFCLKCSPKTSRHSVVWGIYTICAMGMKKFLPIRSWLIWNTDIPVQLRCSVTWLWKHIWERKIKKYHYRTYFNLYLFFLVFFKGGARFWAILYNMFSRSLFLASWFLNCLLHSFMYLYLWLHYFFNRRFLYRREDSFTVLIWSPLSTKDRFQWFINSTKFPPVLSSTLQTNPSKTYYITFYSTML